MFDHVVQYIPSVADSVLDAIDLIKELCNYYSLPCFVFSVSLL